MPTLSYFPFSKLYLAELLSSSEFVCLWLFNLDDESDFLSGF